MAFVVTEHDTLVPDARRGQSQPPQSSRKQIHRGSPDLAIEVVSATDTAAHLKIKVDVYLLNGSKTVWVVYPDSQSLMVHSGDTARELKGDQTIKDPLLPGFSVRVSSFFDSCRREIAGQGRRCAGDLQCGPGPGDSRGQIGRPGIVLRPEQRERPGRGHHRPAVGASADLRLDAGQPGSDVGVCPRIGQLDRHFRGDPATSSRRATMAICLRRHS